MRAKTTPETLRKVENTARTTMEEWFGDHLIFGPIIAEPWFDIMDNEEYIHVYIIYDGDRKWLDPKLTITLYEILADQLPEEQENTGISKSMVEKSEWLEVYGEGYRGDNFPESARPDQNRQAVGLRERLRVRLRHFVDSVSSAVGTTGYFKSAEVQAGVARPALGEVPYDSLPDAPAFSYGNCDSAAGTSVPGTQAQARVTTSAI